MLFIIIDGRATGACGGAEGFGALAKNFARKLLFKDLLISLISKSILSSLIPQLQVVISSLSFKIKKFKLVTNKTNKYKTV